MPSLAPTGVLLVNLGTPDAPTPAAVRRYLREFLRDPRVVETKGWFSRALWLFFLNAFLLPLRTRRSARKYALIWGEKEHARGAPLAEHTAHMTAQLEKTLKARGFSIQTRWAMRYGQPSIASVLDEMRQQGMSRLLVLPLYPQYAASTTASALDAVALWLKSCRNQPELRVARSFPAHSGYLAALEARVRQHWQRYGELPREGCLLLSFHGLPERCRRLGDPYDAECRATAAALAARLGLEERQTRLSFQSRFGRADWLSPSTAETLAELARQGAPRVDVFTPGFVADCLETLEEIAIAGRALFLREQTASAEKNTEKLFYYIEALNASPAWIEALADLTETHLTGWDVRA
ncbi:MAG: ferrochelatase [Zoogloeaceae bacterium]|jgi:ferrochelatase|nr:ferrochelatase [Zoogloeaceae bacterium]